MIQDAWVDLGKWKTFYRTAGNERPLILLHGSYRSSFIWHRNLPGLSEHFKVYAPDRPRYGQTSGPGNELPDMVDFAVSFAASLGIENAFWIGESRGGGICIRLAAQYPNLVQKLALVSPVGLPPAELPKPPEVGRSRWEWFVERSFESKEIMYDEALKKALLEDIEIATSYEQDRLISLTPSYNTEGLAREMALVSCPTLLVWGRNDPVFPVECIERFKDLMPAVQQAHIIEKTRHLTFFEAASEFNKVVVQFFEE